MIGAEGSPDSTSSGAGDDAARQAQLGARLLLIPTVVCIVQAVVLGVVAITAFADPGSGWGSVIVEVVVLLGLAAGLLAIALGVVQRRSWSRGPLIALELIALLTGLTIIKTWPGILLTVAAAACVLVALSRPAAELLEGGPTPDAS